MKVLVLGNGAHTNKRIIPALNKIKKIDSIFVGDRNVNKLNKVDDVLSIINYEDAFKLIQDIDLTIIATPPYNHKESLRKINGKSKSILIEKPLSNEIKFINSNEFKSIYDSGVVFESIMYFHHPIWEKVKNIINNGEIREIYAEFCVPHQPIDGHRYKKEMGGGSLNDQGIYPISLVTDLFHDEYKIENIEILKNDKYEVDLGGGLNLVSKDIYISCKWGLGDDYKNSLQLIDKSKNEYKIDFIFSKPDNTETKITLNNEVSEELQVGVFDQFEIMYNDILKENLSRFKYSSYENILKRYKLYNSIKNCL